jgi:hypothetical protein
MEKKAMNGKRVTNVPDGEKTIDESEGIWASPTSAPPDFWNAMRYGEKATMRRASYFVDLT